MATLAPPPVRSRHDELKAALGTIGAFSLVYLWIARDGTPAASGLVGHGLGIAGFLLMIVAEVGYTWRKRPGRNGPGPVRLWLQMHIFVGLVGPYLVLLHTAFRFRGLAGVLMLLVLVVVGSGVVGRFAYAEAPHLVERRGGAERGRTRRALALWYVLHVPLSLVVFALAVVHIVAALYYATLLR